MNLYLIALLPHLELREHIESLKEEMSERFGAKHALKSPAHITLQMPFKRCESEEKRLINILQQFASTQKTFEVKLKDFDSFPPRVLFVKITHHKPITLLHKQLKKQLKEKINFKEQELTSQVYPHITIATRDLTTKVFHMAWPEFKQREFKASFTVNSISLLKHNGKYWDIYREFPFKSQL